jgi:hypothetical protein
MDKRALVFLSSRQEELAQYRSWAAEELATDRFGSYLALWRFEDQPASTDPPDAIYLDGVNSSDVLLFIAGREASAASAAEVNRAIERRTDVLCLVLPAEERSPELTDLVNRLRANHTTKDVEVEERGFRRAVADSMRDWIIGRLNYRPHQNRTARLRLLLEKSAERALILWRAARVPDAVARAMAGDYSIGELPGAFGPTSSQPFKILLGPAGAGKTLAVHRFHETAVLAAIDDVLAPVPVILTAAEISQTIEQAAEAKAQDLGAFSLTGISLAIDGLDEIGATRTQSLMEEALILAKAYPRTLVLISGRNAPPEHLNGFAVELPPLTDAEARSLIQRVAGDQAARRYDGTDGTIREALRRPLFALTFASGDVLAAEQPIAAALIQRALHRHERAHILAEQFQRLAAGVLDASSASVPIETFNVVEQQDLLASRLVFEQDGQFKIPIRIIAEQAASTWLAKQPPERALERIDSIAADRWGSAITDYLQQLDDRSAEDFAFTAVSRDLAIAIGLARDHATPARQPWTAEGLKRSIEAGDRAFSMALPRLYENTRTSVTVSERRGAYVVERTDLDEAGRLALVTTSFEGTNTPLSGLRIATTYLVSRIENAIKNRSFDIDYEPLTEEILWNEARELMGIGNLSQAPIDLVRLAERLQYLPQGRIKVGTMSFRLYEVDTLRLGRRVNELMRLGNAVWVPPFVIGDLPHGRWVWSRYSPDAIVARRRAQIESALEAYRRIVDEWLPGVSRRMAKRTIMPAVVRERISFAVDGTPVRSTYWLPNDPHAESVVDIQLGPEFEFRSVMEESQAAIERYRPDLTDGAPISMSNGILSTWDSQPVEHLAYEWLNADLHRLGLTKSSRVPE